MVNPGGPGRYFAGSSGVMVSFTESWPASGAIAPWARLTLIWLSDVMAAFASEPACELSAMSKLPEAGALLVAASAGGGLTHRYGGLGMNPSRRGRPANGLRWADTDAPAR